jgi:UDP-perosamine 4-acetyltransferase
MSMTSSEPPVAIIGAGSHGRVVLATLLAAGRTVLGFIDHDVRPGTSVDGYGVLGTEAALEPLGREALELALGIGLLPHRRTVYEHLSMAGYRFARVAHPQVVINGPAAIGPGVQLMAGVVLQPGVDIGPNVLVNTRASIDHECVIGAHVVVSPGAVLCGNVIVEDGATIGPNATITRGVRVGAGSVVAAGAVVVSEVAPGTTVYGVPARAK